MRTNDQKFWAVRDPAPASELQDVLMEFSLPEFARYVLGLQATGAAHEIGRMCFYDSKAEATRDAVQRMEGQELIDRAVRGEILGRPR